MRAATPEFSRTRPCLTESAAITYGPEGIRVNAIAPGSTLNDMIEEWDPVSPGTIDRACYVTGAILRVDGGTWV
jgi:hypothetical protein